MSNDDATIAGFRLLFDKDRNLVTEVITVPDKDFREALKKHPYRQQITAAVHRTNALIKEAHQILQEEING